MKKALAGVSHGVGRRKSSVARVWLKAGKGAITVNGKSSDAYFDTDTSRETISAALKAVDKEKAFDITVNVKGGGMVGQSGAIKLGIARALLDNDANLRGELKKAGLLTVDSRIKERKKPGQPGARKKFQFVKR